MSKEASNSVPGQGSDAPALFEVPPVPAVPAAARGAARVKRPDRRQGHIVTCSLDAMLAEDHQARAVWDYVEGLDLSCLYDPIRSVEGSAGRDAIDPRILMALWLQATLDAVGS